MIQRLSRYLHIYLIVIAAVLAFGNIVRDRFVFDDMSTVVNNTVIKDFENMPVLFSKSYFRPSGTGYFTISGEGSYRPVVTFSYFLDYAVWGMSSFGFHLTNLALHILTVLVFYLFVVRVSANRTIAFTASLLYAVHPVLTEAVNCVSFREDILCALFFWLALAIHYRNKRRSVVAAVFLTISCALCLFSKEMGIVLLPSMVILDFFRRNPKERLSKAYFSIDYIVVLLVTVAYVAVRFFILKNPHDEQIGYPGNSFFINGVVMMQVMARYLRLLFYPVGLTADYSEYFPKPTLTVWYTMVSFLYGFTVICTVTFACISAYRKHKQGICALAVISVVLFFVSLMPVMNIMPIKNIIAERYLYLPFGFFALAAGGLAGKWRVKKNIFYLLCIVVITTLFLCLTVSRNHQWSHGIRLWRSTLRVNPRSFHAHNNLASLYDEYNRFNQAEYHYKQAIKIRPYDGIPYYNLANTLKEQGRLTESIPYYLAAIEREPDIVEPYVNLGLAYARLGKQDKAIDAFRTATRVRPVDSSAHNNLGVMLGSIGKTDEAINEHILAIKYDPRNENAYVNLAICYLDKQSYTKALGILKRLISINPKNAEAYFMAGKSYEALGDLKQAYRNYKQAMELQPNHTRALQGLRRVVNQ